MSELDGSRKGPPKPPKPMPLPSGRASRTNITERESPVTTSEREENKPALIFSLDKSKEKNQSYVKKNKFLSPEHWETKKRETVSSMLSPGQEESRIDLSGCGSTNDLSPSVQKKNHERIDMYHNTHFGVQWAYLTISLHVLQFGLLLPLGFEALSTASLVPLLLLSTAVPGLVLVARYCTHKQPKSVDWSYLSIKSPQQETDGVPDRVVLLLSLAALLEGGAYALFSVATTGEHSRGDLSGRGVKSFDTITQILGFSAIVNFGLHRVLRPANRLDPLRSVLEVEIIGICWDALDGATLYQLLATGEGLGEDIRAAVRVLMFCWYLSVGCRLAMMYSAHLTPHSRVYQLIFPPAMAWSDEPTVDRTLASLTFKSSVTLAMSLSQFLAASLRMTLLVRGRLDTVQQEMMVKNLLFLLPAVSAVLKFYQTKGRYWNTRKILQLKIPYLDVFINIQKPLRALQVEVLRFSFCFTYLLVGTMFSVFLARVTGQYMWLVNVATDVLCVAVFLRVCCQVHCAEVWIIFPKKVACGLSVVLALNMYLARVIGLYSNAGRMSSEDEQDWNYTNAMLLVLTSIVPICTYALFWAASNMLFHKEFTACPENYNAVHDPGITLVAGQTMLEGALDIVSCAALLSLATEPNLPLHMDVIVVFFAFLEIANACQCFVLQVMLSGGHDDTPAHLVTLRSRLRQGRGLIDLGTFTLRLILWLHYDAVASVFMIKNLFNLLHTIALVERSKGVDNYSAGTLFLSYVSPRDWYGMTKEEWRAATRESIGQQARAGIAV